MVSVALFAVIEFLRQFSNRNNGIVHVSDPNKASVALLIGYNYLPTIIGVLYSILWSYIDADAKRLEPYYQMRAKTSPASNLTLDYFFESSFTGAVQAFKRRHWRVGMIGAAYLLISLVFPASQGALLALEKVSIYEDPKRFEIQDNILEDHNLVQGEPLTVAVTWLQTWAQPPWVYGKYFVAPFLADGAPPGINGSWAAETSVAYVEPQCRKFSIKDLEVSYSCCMIDVESVYYPGTYLTAIIIDLHDKTCQMALSIRLDSALGYPQPPRFFSELPDNPSQYIDGGTSSLYLINSPLPIECAGRASVR